MFGWFTRFIHPELQVAVRCFHWYGVTSEIVCQKLTIAIVDHPNLRFGSVVPLLHAWKSHANNSIILTEPGLIDAEVQIHANHPGHLHDVFVFSFRFWHHTSLWPVISNAFHSIHGWALLFVSHNLPLNVDSDTILMIIKDANVVLKRMQCRQLIVPSSYIHSPVENSDDGTASIFSEV